MLMLRLTCLVILAGFSACGPSPRWTHLGNRYFEYCHRADLERVAGDAELAACWDGWLENYAVGQSRDRLQHAKERRLLLRGGEALRVSLPSVSSHEIEAADHSQTDSPQDCPGLCNQAFEGCVTNCDAGDCVPACEQEERVCRQGCL